MKWTKSFLLHPWFNRFNLLYLAAGLVATISVPVDGVGWAVVLGEAAYLLVRGVLDRGGAPALQMRRLPYKSRNRYLQIWQTADQVRTDLKINKHTAVGLPASYRQVNRLLRTFLELSLLHDRIDRYLRSRRVNYAQEIAKANQRMAAADENERRLLASNIEVLQKRKVVTADLVKRLKSIESRLDATENSLRLLSEVSIGLSDPAEVSSQVEVILANVEDAESFVHELQEVVAPLRVEV